MRVYDAMIIANMKAYSAFVCAEKIICFVFLHLHPLISAAAAAAASDILVIVSINTTQN